MSLCAALLHEISKIGDNENMDNKLLDILVCPVCKGALVYKKEAGELICKFDRLAFPVRDDIPVMLEDEARELTAEELEK
jgi:uncharacterized protein YbaR (Trm112 family)